MSTPDLITATQQMEMAFRNDIRFRRLVDMSVHQAVSDSLGTVPDELRMRDVYEVATRAAALALKMAFDGDAEIIAAHIERDHYKKIAESALMYRPLTMVIPKPD